MDEVNFGGSLGQLRDMMRVVIKHLRIPLGLQASIPVRGPLIGHQALEIWHFQNVGERILQAIGRRGRGMTKAGPLTLMSLDITLVGLI
jgi:hypothetical protein